MKTDILIVGCGVAGLYCALNLPEDKKITIITKNEAPKSDSFLTQGGICVLRDKDDFQAFYEDTMKAGHYENNPQSVEIMIRSSQDVIGDLVSYGVNFEKDGKSFHYTREGAHSKPRILFHEDETGKEITSHLLKTARSRANITLIENYTMVDLICDGNMCCGIVGHDAGGNFSTIVADYMVLATGGVGGLFKHSTNYPHLTGDALALALNYDIKLQHIDYIQIHPTTLYTKKDGREFLISESVRGEGAILLNAKGERFVNELLVLVLVNDGDHLHLGRLIISTDDLIQRCSAMESVQNIINDIIQIFGNDTNSALDVDTENEMIHDHTTEVCTQQAENDGLAVMAQCGG